LSSTQGGRDAFASIYDISVANQTFGYYELDVDSNKVYKYRDILSGTAGYINSADNQNATNPLTTSAWVADLLTATQIDHQLTVQSGARDAFAKIYYVSVANQTFGYYELDADGNKVYTYRDVLSGTAGYINSADNQGSDNPITAAGWATQCINMVALDESLTAQDRINFEIIFGIAVADQKFSNEAYRNIIAGFAGSVTPNAAAAAEVTVKSADIVVATSDSNIGDTSVAQRMELKQSLLSYSGGQSPQIVTKQSTLKTLGQ
jgi:hypothetical protein